MGIRPWGSSAWAANGQPWSERCPRALGAVAKDARQPSHDVVWVTPVHFRQNKVGETRRAGPAIGGQSPSRRKSWWGLHHGESLLGLHHGEVCETYGCWREVLALLPQSMAQYLPQHPMSKDPRGKLKVRRVILSRLCCLMQCQWALLLLCSNSCGHQMRWRMNQWVWLPDHCWSQAAVTINSEAISDNCLTSTARNPTPGQ